MTRPAASAHPPALGQAPTTDRAQAAPPTSGAQTLLYGVSLVTALPPDALLAPPDVALPAIRDDAHPILHALDLESLLDRPMARVGHGSVALEQVDRRMRGLVASFDLSRTVDPSAMLICLGVVEADRTASRAGGATVEDLRGLVCETLHRRGAGWSRQTGIGHGALLVLYGGIIAQTVWVNGDRLVTVTVTSLHGEDHTREAARSIAYLLDRRLTT
jgi:hypothetical protein